NLLIYCSPMATLPVEGRWSIKSVGRDDIADTLAFLRRDPLINVYLIARIIEERFSSSTQTVEVRHNREIVLVASLATNIVLAGDRERVRELVEQKRSVIRIVDGMIAAKCEYSAVTDDMVQLMGVWTNPRLRRRGHARALLREVCGHLARKGKTVTLFVNDFNL